MVWIVQHEHRQRNSIQRVQDGEKKDGRLDSVGGYWFEDAIIDSE